MEFITAVIEDRARGKHIQLIFEDETALIDIRIERNSLTCTSENRSSGKSYIESGGFNNTRQLIECLTSNIKKCTMKTDLFERLMQLDMGNLTADALRQYRNQFQP